MDGVAWVSPSMAPGAVVADSLEMQKFRVDTTRKVWSLNALLVVNDVLVAIMVGIGAYGHRYRRRPFTRILYDGAVFLFLPIMSYVVSGMDSYYTVALGSYSENIVLHCFAGNHVGLVLIWTALVQIIGINTSAMVAVDDREDRSIAPPVILLVQAIWTSYLMLNDIPNFFNVPVRPKVHLPFYYLYSALTYSLGYLLLLPFALTIAKMATKLCAFHMARRSFALGRNPRLIVGYMEEQVQQQLQAGVASTPPPLLVMGEEAVPVEKHPHGCRFKWTAAVGITDGNRLVTMDGVWRLNENDHVLQGPRTRLKDVCLSFALFKMMRCRFARYTIAEAGFHKVSGFFWHALLKDSNDGRVLGVIADELSFLHDYYYSSFPLSYSNRWLPISSIFISLISIVYCLFALIVLPQQFMYSSSQLTCLTKSEDDQSFNFGSVYFDVVPVYLLAALVVLTEAREIASYICSNWTKVALIRCYLNHDSWQRSHRMQKCIGRVLRWRCKLLKHWQDKMNQCSILVLHPGKAPVALLRRLLPVLTDQKKNIMVPRAVKTAVIDKLRSYEGTSRNGVISLRRSLQVGDNFLWELNGKSTTETMLVCHIATSILEVRHPNSASDHQVAATHLSCYCAYLVAYTPELLPDDDAWCKSFYMEAKKDAERVLAGRVAASTPEDEYQQLVALLTAESKHEVIRNGASLGKKLAELVQREDTVWEVLAGFWSEMLLYVAPSENLNGHADAIARGGELITLLWALLAHVGIVSRADTTAAAPVAG